MKGGTLYLWPKFSTSADVMVEATASGPAVRTVGDEGGADWTSADGSLGGGGVSTVGRSRIETPPPARRLSSTGVGRFFLPSPSGSGEGAMTGRLPSLMSLLRSGWSIILVQGATMVEGTNLLTGEDTKTQATNSEDLELGRRTATTMGETGGVVRVFPSGSPLLSRFRIVPPEEMPRVSGGLPHGSTQRAPRQLPRRAFSASARRADLTANEVTPPGRVMMTRLSEPSMRHPPPRVPAVTSSPAHCQVQNTTFSKPSSQRQLQVPNSRQLAGERTLPSPKCQRALSLRTRKRGGHLMWLVPR